MSDYWPNASAMTLGQRIRFARGRAKMTQDAVAELFGISRNSVSLWENDRTSPETDKMSKLAELLRVPAGWLLTGKEHGHIADESNVQGLAADAYRRQRVPLVSRVPGGPDRDATDPYAVGNAEQWLTPTEPLGANSFALRVIGQSMEPDFPDGCVIFIDPSVQWKSGDFVVVRFPETDEATFKKIVTDGGAILLVPLNTQYPTRKLETDFVVVGVVREMRKLIR
jgi:SOS-response transcriptional repressor LexA